MADIRIKDLTTTASSTASDDFIAVDGTTNGTRKLNAFSPTFGGNATVTGTLTVNGTGASSFGGRLAIGATALSDRMFYVSGSTGTTGASQFAAVVNPTIPNTVTTGAYGLYLGTNIATGATVTNGYSLFIAAPDYTGSTITNKYGLYSNDPNPSYFVGNVLVGSTTASTTTSTGALVVGNGTSGGLGVGGSVNVGGTLTVSGTSSLLTVANSTGSAMLAVFASAYATGSATPYLVIGSFSDPATSGARIAVSTDYSLDNRASIQLQTRTTAGTLQTALTLANTRNATFAADVAISGTTASTSTSSGALVVSGGVGVGGAINAGGTITSTTSTDSGVLQLNLVNSSTGTSASSLFRFNAGTRTATLQAYNDTHATLAGQLRIATSNGDIAVIPSGVTAATFTASGTTFAGAIAIGNTVNTVSPTSPNRTITMVIGGTTYYLAAKTTND